MPVSSLPARLLLSLSISLGAGTLLTLVSGLSPSRVSHADSAPPAPPVEPQVQQPAPPIQGVQANVIAELNSPPAPQPPPQPLIDEVTPIDQFGGY